MVSKPTIKPEIGHVVRAPDYGLPIHKATQCKTGTHIWVTIGREPRAGDYCACGLHQWPKKKLSGV